MRNTVFRAAAIVVAGIASTAQAAAPAATAIYGKVTEEDLRQLVLAHGDTVMKVHTEDDKPSIRAKSSGGLIYSMFGTACDSTQNQRCQGIMMQVTYGDDDVTAEKIVEAGNKYAAVSTWWQAEDKTLGVTRYVVLDEGVTWANIEANLDVLLSIAPQAAEIATKK